MSYAVLMEAYNEIYQRMVVAEEELRKTKLELADLARQNLQLVRELDECEESEARMTQKLKEQA